jgi:hypothetical protein
MRHEDLWARPAPRGARTSTSERGLDAQERARDLLRKMPTVEEFRARAPSREALEAFLRLRAELEAAVRGSDAPVRFGGQRR